MDTPIAGYGWFIKRIDNALEKEANANLQKLNLTMQQNRVLIYLAHAEGNTMSLKALEELRRGAVHHRGTGVAAGEEGPGGSPERPGRQTDQAGEAVGGGRETARHQPSECGRIRGAADRPPHRRGEAVPPHLPQKGL